MMRHDEKCCTHQPEPANEDVAIEQKEPECDSATSDNESTSNTSDFTSKVLKKKLRCVKV